MQPGVLGLGLLEDGDVGIGVFPEGEEILIRLAPAELSPINAPIGLCPLVPDGPWVPFVEIP